MQVVKEEDPESNLNDGEIEKDSDADEVDIDPLKEGISVDVHGSNKFGVFFDDDEELMVNDKAIEKETKRYE
jgi:hypothetical protein